MAFGGKQCGLKQANNQTGKTNKKPAVPEGEFITVGAPTRIIALEQMQGEVEGRAALRIKKKLESAFKN